jgi:ESX secretion-associated protein EspG
VLPGSARLPLDALARLVRQERIGELPDVLAPTAVWRPAADENAARARAHEEASRLGWLDRRGQLDAEVSASLAVVCRGGVEFKGWISSASAGDAGVLVAATGREAVLAVARRGEVSLRRAQPKKLPETLVAQIPDIRAGGGATVSVPLDDLRSAAKWRRPESATVAAKPVPGADLRQVLHITGLSTTGSGELWVAIRDSMGRRRQIPYPLRYADTESGRYLNLATLSGNGELWLLVAPATRHDLAARLRILHHAAGNLKTR